LEKNFFLKKKESNMGFFAQRRGFFRLLFIYLLITLVLVGVLEIDETSQAGRIVFSGLSWIPLVLSTYVLYYEYARLIFDDDKKNDKEIKVINLILVSTVWVISWANIFMVIWSWDQTSWLLLNGVNAFTAWIRLASTTLLMAPGIGFAAHVPVTTWAHITAGIMGWSSFALIVLIIATGIEAAVDAITENLNNGNQSNDQRQQQRKNIVYYVGDENQHNTTSSIEQVDFKIN
jgi:hypothetical protein